MTNPLANCRIYVVAAVIAVFGVTLPVQAQFKALRQLEAFKAPKISRPLTDIEKHNLCKTFVRAYVTMVRHRDNSAEIISTELPVYRLFESSFPGVKKREIEAGALIHLAAIVLYINSLPEYSADVDQVIQQGVSPRFCR